MLLSEEKETRVKFNPGLSANRPSNNWALIFILFLLCLGRQMPLAAVQKLFVNF